MVVYERDGGQWVCGVAAGCERSARRAELRLRHSSGEESQHVLEPDALRRDEEDHALQLVGIGCTQDDAVSARV